MKQSVNMEIHEEKRNQWLVDHVTLPVALGIAIVAAMGIVSIAYWLYWTNGNRKYDIARAGQQTGSRIVEDDESSAVDMTRPVGVEDITKKLKFLNEELTSLDKIDGYEAEDLSDQAIQLAAPTSR